MKIHADFDKAVQLDTESMPWVASPMAGVERKMLDRVGGEVARATSIVRYAPNSQFSAHTHTGGEEFFVLDGVFQDEHGDYPTGTYVRNPPTTRHTPRSDEGCVIFVKLWQFASEDRDQFQKNMDAELPAASDGIAKAVLYKDDREHVSYYQINGDTALTLSAEGGIELYVLHGSLINAQKSLAKGTWLRLPIGQSWKGHAGKEGARFWMKSGHLRHVSTPPSCELLSN